MQEKENLISLSCSGESVEKTLTLYYWAYISDSLFYDNFNVSLFYGHNLPKKSKDIQAHGSLGFYDKYYSDKTFFPPCSKGYIIEQKNLILQKFISNRYITWRAAEKLASNDENFWLFVSKVPFEYIYPDFMNKLINNSSSVLGIKKIIPLLLEKNFPSILGDIVDSRECYSIFALDVCGTVGRYYLKYYDMKQWIHLCSDLSKRPVLSGNSAILLKQISQRLPSNIIVGYRQHNTYKRPNRDHALKLILSKRTNILEPANKEMYKFFKVNGKFSEEEKANMAYAAAYEKYISDNRFSLKL